MQLATAICAEEHQEEESTCKPSTEFEERKFIRHQASVIDSFIWHAKRQDECIHALEAKIDEAGPPSKKTSAERRVQT